MAVGGGRAVVGGGRWAGDGGRRGVALFDVRWDGAGRIWAAGVARKAIKDDDRTSCKAIEQDLDMTNISHTICTDAHWPLHTLRPSDASEIAIGTPTHWPHDYEASGHGQNVLISLEGS